MIQKAVLSHQDLWFKLFRKKYRHSFTLDDLWDLKECVGKCLDPDLLNPSSFDEGMEEIFGKPQKMIENANPLDHNGAKKWGMRVLVEIINI